jgi:hypothetical protein
MINSMVCHYCFVVGELSSFLLQVHNFLSSSLCINVSYVFRVFGDGFCMECTNVIGYSTSFLLCQQRMISCSSLEASVWIDSKF